MPRRLPEYDQILALGTNVNPETGNPYKPSEIAEILGVNYNSTQYVLKRNGFSYNPRPSLPYIEGLTPGEKAFFLGLNAGGMKAELRRWVNSGSEYVVVKEFRSRYRTDVNHPLKKALDERRRMVLLQVFPQYADVRDSGTNTKAYMDPEVFKFMVEGVKALNSHFFKAERRVSPFTFALLATRFSEDMYAILPVLSLGMRIKEAYKRLYEVELKVQSRKNREGGLKAIVQVPERDRQKLLAGVLGSKTVRSLPFFSSVMGLECEGKQTDRSSESFELEGVDFGDDFFVDYEEQRKTATSAARNLLNDSNW